MTDELTAADRSVLSVLPPEQHTIRDVLIAHSIDSVENQGLHGWRCRYPDRFGQCQCFDDLVADLVTVTTPQKDT